MNNSNRRSFLKSLLAAPLAVRAMFNLSPKIQTVAVPEMGYISITIPAGYVPPISHSIHVREPGSTEWREVRSITSRVIHNYKVRVTATAPAGYRR
jgi:hypothetical protein